MRPPSHMVLATVFLARAACRRAPASVSAGSRNAHGCPSASAPPFSFSLADRHCVFSPMQSGLAQSFVARHISSSSYLPFKRAVGERQGSFACHRVAAVTVRFTIAFGVRIVFLQRRPRPRPAPRASQICGCIRQDSNPVGSQPFTTRDDAARLIAEYLRPGLNPAVDGQRNDLGVKGPHLAAVARRWGFSSDRRPASARVKLLLARHLCGR